tara:strand:- start:353 stop:1390 length:1038 start_codon:yes stop_codon:yes gene_type:complete
MTQRAEIVLPAGDLDHTISFFSNQLGFQLESIFPADDPEEALMSGYGLRIRFKCKEEIHPGVITILGKEVVPHIIAPNGTEIRFQDPIKSCVIPEETQTIHHSKFQDAEWKIGRAGMEYRDLIPDRYGGQFIASHIRIPKAGPVADYVHFHKIRFQMIYCKSGWAKVVYEDQGDPFIFKGGDCILQPPEIRHRVLENSQGFEVVEISSPARHMTCTDPKMILPNEEINLDRKFDGQSFVFHEADSAMWENWRQPEFKMRDLGILQATKKLAQVQVVRAVDKAESFTENQNTEFHILFLLKGELILKIDGIEYKLCADDSITIPGGVDYSLLNSSIGTEFLEILYL